MPCLPKLPIKPGEARRALESRGNDRCKRHCLMRLKVPTP